MAKNATIYIPLELSILIILSSVEMKHIHSCVAMGIILSPSMPRAVCVTDVCAVTALGAIMRHCDQGFLGNFNNLASYTIFS